MLPSCAWCTAKDRQIAGLKVLIFVFWFFRFRFFKAAVGKKNAKCVALLFGNQLVNCRELKHMGEEGLQNFGKQTLAFLNGFI